MDKAEFIKDNDIYVIKLTFEHGIPVMDNRTYKLEANSVSLNMVHIHQNEDGTVHYFNFDQAKVGLDMKKESHILTLSLDPAHADQSLSMFGQNAPASAALKDLVKANVVLNEDGTLKYEVKDTKKQIVIEFDEDISTTKTDNVLSYVDKNGYGVILDNTNFVITDKVLTLKVNGGAVFPCWHW